MANTNPLEIPEIRINIGQHLGLSDLARYLTVSRSWYASFLPLVWSSVNIRVAGCNPTVESLRRHVHLVKNLTYHTEAWRKYDLIPCSNLLSLELHCNTGSSPIVIAQYDQLRDLVISGGQPRIFTPRPIWKPTHSMLNLLSLKIDQMDIEPAATEVFWDLCSRLHSLDILNTGIARLPDRSMTFERLQKLGLWLRPAHPFEQQLDWIAQCPNLTNLYWSDQSGRMAVSSDAFANRVASGAWPELSELRLIHHSPSDAQLSRIIHGMRQVKALDVYESQFGLPTITALRPHFHVLRKLNTIFTETVMGSIAPEILASCPQLEDFTIGRIMSQDILQGRPWICERSMRSLRLNVAISPVQDVDQHQQLILERISRLINLENLTLRHFQYDEENTQLGLRLGKGLERLSTLKKLVNLNFLNYTQELSTAEAQVSNDILVTLMSEKVCSAEDLSLIFDPS